MFLKLASQESLTLEKEGWVVLGGLWNHRILELKEPYGLSSLLQFYKWSKVSLGQQFLNADTWQSFLQFEAKSGGKRTVAMSSSWSCVYSACFPGGSVGKSICLQFGRPGFDPWVGKIPWRRTWQPTPVFLPGESPWTEDPSGLPSVGSQSRTQLSN